MEKKDYNIIKLKDGSVEKILSSGVYHQITADNSDYGAEYISYLTIYLTTLVIRIKTVDCLNFLSIATMIKIFAKDFSNMTEKEFSLYLEAAIKNSTYFDNVEYEIKEKV